MSMEPLAATFIRQEAVEGIIRWLCDTASRSAWRLETVAVDRGNGPVARARPGRQYGPDGGERARITIEVGGVAGIPARQVIITVDVPPGPADHT